MQTARESIHVTHFMSGAFLGEYIALQERRLRDKAKPLHIERIIPCYKDKDAPDKAGGIIIPDEYLSWAHTYENYTVYLMDYRFASFTPDFMIVDREKLLVTQFPHAEEPAARKTADLFDIQTNQHTVNSYLAEFGRMKNRAQNSREAIAGVCPAFV